MVEIIAHRANIYGPNVFTENTLAQVKRALDVYDFSVELDVWFYDGSHWLGHDHPSKRLSEVDFNTLVNDPRLFFHAKNLKTYQYMFSQMDRYDIKDKADLFLHGEDAVALTRNGRHWLYPVGDELETCGLKSRSVLLLPEMHHLNTRHIDKMREFAYVCTDYPVRYEEILR